jgi:signal transduction histidine kinase
VRRHILFLVVGMTTLVVVAFAIPLAILIRHNAYRDGVNSLTAEASDIARYLRSENAVRSSAEITAHLKEIGNGRRASVQLADGTVLGQAPPGDLAELPSPAQRRFGGGGDRAGASGAATAPATATASPSGGGDGGQLPGTGADPGAFGQDLQAQSWSGGKVAQLSVPGFNGFGGGSTVPSGAPRFYTVRVYATDGQLHSGETGELILLIGVAIALLIVGGVAGEVLTRRIVRPLVDTADTAQRLGTGDTTARAPTTGPAEIADVGLALNRLADRIDQLIAEERETVADLSHRLRTPLTALRLDAEALRDPADAERVGGHVSTLERMLTAVIRAARRPQREGRIPSCDATSVVAERVEFWSALAEDQERASSVSLPGVELRVRAGEEDLAAAVDALVENVIAHTPEGTAFAVTLAPTGAGARLTISDDGPGLPPDAAERGRSDRGSSGLGLDIARRCAEASGGRMELGASPSGGASVTLELGPP